MRERMESDCGVQSESVCGDGGGGRDGARVCNVTAASSISWMSRAVSGLANIAHAVSGACGGATVTAFWTDGRSCRPVHSRHDDAAPG